MRIRTALLALAAMPLALSAVPASAGSVTVPGCYGVSDTIVCDPTVEYTDPPGVEFYSTTVPVCAGACYDVPVTLVNVVGSGSTTLCASWTDVAGTPHRVCSDELIDTISPEPPDLARTVDKIVAMTAAARDKVVALVYEVTCCLLPRPPRA